MAQVLSYEEALGLKQAAPASGGKVLSYEEAVGLTPPADVAMEGRDYIKPGADPAELQAADEAAAGDFSTTKWQDKGYGGGMIPGDPPISDNPAANYIGGFNKNLAVLLDAPSYVVNSAMEKLGAEFFTRGRKPTLSQTKQVFRDAGINVDPVEGVASRLGEDTLNAIIAAGMFYASAPTLLAGASAPGASTTARVGGEIARPFLEKPLTTAATEALATAGARFGEESGVPGGALLGAMGGAMTVPAAGMTAKASGKLFAPAAAGLGAFFGADLGPAGMLLGGAGGLTAVRAGRGGLETFFSRRAADKVATEARPLIFDDVNPMQPTVYAQEQIAGDLAKVNQTVENAMRRVAGRPPEEASTAARQELEKAYKVARRLEDRYWSRVPKDAEIDATGLKLKTQEMVTKAPRLRMEVESPGSAPADTPPSAIPTEFTDRIMKMQDTQTVEGLMTLRSDLLRAIRDERASTAPHDGRIRNLNILQDQVLDAIQAGLPDSTVVTQAREYSRRMADLFKRGPVGRVLRFDRTGGERVPEGEMVQSLLRQHGGIEQVGDVATAMRRPQLVAQVDDAVTGIFREVAEQKSPKQVEAWLNNNRKQISALKDASQKLAQTTADLAEAVKREQEIKASAFHKYAQIQDPQKGVQTMFAGQNPAKVAREIVGRLRGDADALAGFRNETLQYFMQRNRASPTKMLAELKGDTAQARLMREVLAPDQYARLFRIAKAGSEIEQGGTDQLEKAFRGGGTLLAGILGATVGRAISPTIQVPAMTANLARRMFSAQMTDLPPSEKLIALAITDPKWERVLLSKVPQSPKEMEALTARLRLLIAAEANARQKEMELLGRGEED